MARSVLQKFTASPREIRVGDRVTYLGQSFVAGTVSEPHPGLFMVSGHGYVPQSIAEIRDVEIERWVTERPYVVLTRDYDAMGNKDVRRFTFATAKAQQSFISRTNRCVTFSN